MILVKDVIALAAENMGRSDLSEAVAATMGPPKGEVETLLRCYNLVENEVALDYYPLKATETVSPVEGRVPYASLSRALVDVYKVRADGAPLAFELFPTYLYVTPAVSRAEVEYAYSPEEKALGDGTAFSDKISARLLSYGVASEFCLSSRKFSEGAMWGRKYRDALRAAGVYRRTLSVRSRRWV